MMKFKREFWEYNQAANPAEFQRKADGQSGLTRAARSGLLREIKVSGTFSRGTTKRFLTPFINQNISLSHEWERVG